jgi:hypothetical protein
MYDFDEQGNVVQIDDPPRPPRILCTQVTSVAPRTHHTFNTNIDDIGASVIAQVQTVRTEALEPTLLDHDRYKALPSPGYRVSIGFTMDLSPFGDWARYPDGRKMHEFDKNARIQITSVCAIIDDNPANFRFFVSPEVAISDVAGSFNDASGWVESLSQLFDGAACICMFNAPLFFGVLQKYYPSQGIMAVWRHRTFDPFTISRCSTQVWVSSQHLLDKNPVAVEEAGGLHWSPSVGRAADDFSACMYGAVRKSAWEGARVSNGLYVAVRRTGQLTFEKMRKKSARDGSATDVEKSYSLKITLPLMNERNA